MAEVFLEYQTPLFVDNGLAYRARACGGEAHDGTHRWHGWIEFLPIEGGSPVRTARETTQPDRTCTVYWSTGLTRVYLEGALARALRLAEVQRPVAHSFRMTGLTRGHPLPSRAAANPWVLSGVRTNSLLELTASDRWFLKSLAIAPG
jgi:hypothetical protein